MNLCVSASPSRETAKNCAKNRIDLKRVVRAFEGEVNIESHPYFTSHNKLKRVKSFGRDAKGVAVTSNTIRGSHPSHPVIRAIK
ncbi:uncharacterized protein Dana_GF26284 [Drosophila ananassae]|uniref:Uncharacterized protein n=1 Tax=Drosophila ananassae TaxID=7217 RepID=A0A0P9C9J4_DROAN|nr:uncharacterized protein Dana_GF26284 [Drosophila ananassae]